MNDEQMLLKARKKVAAVKGFYVVAAIFGSITVILLVISNQFYGEEAFWIRFPILILTLILGIIYIAMFGLPTMRFTDHAWEEEQIEREIAKMRLEQRSAQEGSIGLEEEEERLELRAFEYREIKRDKHV